MSLPASCCLRGQDSPENKPVEGNYSNQVQVTESLKIYSTTTSNWDRERERDDDDDDPPLV